MAPTSHRNLGILTTTNFLLTYQSRMQGTIDDTHEKARRLRRPIDDDVRLHRNSSGTILLAEKENNDYDEGPQTRKKGRPPPFRSCEPNKSSSDCCPSWSKT